MLSVCCIVHVFVCVAMYIVFACVAMYIVFACIASVHIKCHYT